MMHGYQKYHNGTEYICDVGNPTAGRNWYKTLVKWLLEYGFEQCESDPCYFKITRDGKCLHMIVWVDDIISFCDSDDLYNEFASAFFGKFKGSDFGTDLHEWNSMKIDQMPWRGQHFHAALHQRHGQRGLPGRHAPHLPDAG